jgi:hypothetical protein
LFAIDETLDFLNRLSLSDNHGSFLKKWFSLEKRLKKTDIVEDDTRPANVPQKKTKAKKSWLHWIFPGTIPLK